MLQKASHTKSTPLRRLLKQANSCLVLMGFQDEKLGFAALKMKAGRLILNNFDDRIPDDPAGMLTAFDISEVYANNKEDHHAYVQNVDAGVYIIIAKDYEVVM